jgi:hypothetical protein
MKIEHITLDEFKSYIQSITVCHLLSSIPHSKIKDFVKIQKIKLETLRDFIRLENTKLVWYKNATGEKVGWDAEDAKNIELKDEAACPTDENIVGLIESFKAQGLTKDIKIISVTDSKLNEEVIVDGVKRGVALYHCFLNKPEVINSLIAPSQGFGIYLINFQSPASSIFFPLDFLNFYEKVDK